MNKKVLLGFAATALLGAVAVAPTTLADNDKSLSTDGSISFYNTNKPGGGPFQNNLALAFVPSTFDFGSHDISGEVGTAATYNQKIAVGEKQYLAVSDDRESKLKGWKVVAKATDFTSVKADASNPQASDKLSADLLFKVGENQKYNIDTVESDKIQTATPEIQEAGSLEALTATQAAYYGGVAAGKFVTLPVGGAEQEVLTYKTQSQEVAGTQGVAREISSVQLKVKNLEGVAKSTYKGTVNWILTEDV